MTTFFWTALIIIALTQAVAVAILSAILAIMFGARFMRFAYKEDVAAVKMQADLNALRLNNVEVNTLPGLKEEEKRNPSSGNSGTTLSSS